MLRPLQSTRRSSGPVRGSFKNWAGQTVRSGEGSTCSSTFSSWTSTSSWIFELRIFEVD